MFVPLFESPEIFTTASSSAKAKHVSFHAHPYSQHGFAAIFNVSCTTHTIPNLCFPYALSFVVFLSFLLFFVLSSILVLASSCVVCIDFFVSRFFVLFVCFRCFSFVSHFFVIVFTASFVICASKRFLFVFCFAFFSVSVLLQFSPLFVVLSLVFVYHSLLVLFCLSFFVLDAHVFCCCVVSLFRCWLPFPAPFLCVVSILSVFVTPQTKALCEHLGGRRGLGVAQRAQLRLAAAPRRDRFSSKYKARFAHVLFALEG